MKGRMNGRRGGGMDVEEMGKEVRKSGNEGGGGG